MEPEQLLIRCQEHSYGYFTLGPCCQYVPVGDGIEQLKHKIDTGAIPFFQNVARIYSVSNGTVAATIIQQGLQQNVGYFYLTKMTSNVWEELGTSDVWNS